AEDVLGHPVGYEDLRDALLAALDAAGIDVEPGELTAGERKGVAKVSARVGSDEAIRRVSSERFRADAPPGTRVGFGNEKGRKLCRAGVAVDYHGIVAAAMVAGDMHVSPPDLIDRVAQALVGARALDQADLRGRIAGVFEAPDVHQADATLGVTTDDLLAAVLKAVAAADTAPGGV
nr:hypothetical protein [Acidimicrobiia bacterium]